MRTMELSSKGDLSTEFWDARLGGVIVIKGTAMVRSSEGWEDTIYRASDAHDSFQPQHMVAIPYYANTNRGPVEMAVWLPVRS
jgi:DUF1680 family protein